MFAVIFECLRHAQSLLVGKPNLGTSGFPFASLAINTRTPISQRLRLTLEGDNPTEALQYNVTPGFRQVLGEVRGFQEYMQGRKASENWGLTLDFDSQDLLYKAVTALANPDDPVLP